MNTRIPATFLLKHCTSRLLLQVRQSSARVLGVVDAMLGFVAEKLCVETHGRDHAPLGGIRNMMQVFGSDTHALQHLKEVEKWGVELCHQEVDH